MTKQEHVHKYKKFETVYGKGFWRCLVPGCPHVIYDQSLLFNRQHQCWLCGETMLLDDASLEVSKPICSHCKQYRKARKQRV